MKTRITVTVHKNIEGLWEATWKGGSAKHFFIIQGKKEAIFGPTPDHYKAIYSLAPKTGTFIVLGYGGSVARFTNPEGKDAWVVTCFLEKMGWQGMRVNRKVVPL